MDLQKRINNDFKHHPPPDQERIRNHELVRQTLRDVALEMTDICPEGRELSLCLTKLEEAMFWANAALAR